MDEIRLEARAKINLGLDVLRRREDGYHEVKMVMQTVDICDVLSFRKLEEDRILVSTDKEELPGDENNLIYKAIKLMKDIFGIREGVAAALKKRIPMAAGMAGGSADAAAAIHGMDRLFSLGLSLEEKQNLGVKIGADVPYCLMGGTADPSAKAAGGLPRHRKTGYRRFHGFRLWKPACGYPDGTS